MSQENVEIVRRSFAAFNSGGVEEVISGGLWSPEIVMDASAVGIPGVGVYRGFEEVKAFLADDWFTVFPFEEWEIAIDELVDYGDRVLAMSRQRGRGASSGAVAAELALANIVTLHEGKTVRFELYRDRGKALEAARLSE